MSNNIDWKKELKKCALDKTRIYMIENYVFRTSLWKGQREILSCIPNRKVTLSVKSRGVGYTSLMAAFTACEMVLNCDCDDLYDSSRYDMVYISHTEQDKRIFLKKVLEYINIIPKELWTGNFNYHYINNDRELHLGFSRLTLAPTGNTGFTYSNDKTPKYVIYDEMVKRKDDFDFNDPIEEQWEILSEKIVIGGCPNHFNKKFYDYVKDYKEKYGDFIRMKWLDNPLHSVEEYELRKRYSYDSYSFDDEFNCEVFKLEKIIL